MGHGNYRTIHFREAIAEAEERGELLVGLDEVLWRCPGTESVQAIHIVGAPKFWEQDEPTAYRVELIRPRWMYGNEGHLHPVRWVGHLDEFTDEEFDEMEREDSPLSELLNGNVLPEAHSWLWAIPKADWLRCEIRWWETFRKPLAQ